MTKRWMAASLVPKMTKWEAEEGEATGLQRQTQLQVIKARLSAHFLNKGPDYIPVAQGRIAAGSSGLEREGQR